MSEHYWVTFDGDADTRMCARCDAQYPTDAPCTDAPLPVAVLMERVVEAIAAMGGMTTEEARAGLTAFVRGVMR